MDEQKRKSAGFVGENIRLSVCGFSWDIQNLCHLVEIQKRDSAVRQICDIWHKTISFLWVIIIFCSDLRKNSCVFGFKMQFIKFFRKLFGRFDFFYSGLWNRGVSPIWGTPLFWWGLCKIVQPHFVRLSYEDKATVNWTAKEAFPHFWGYLPRIGEMCSILSESFSDVSKTGQTPAADLTHPVSRLKIQPRNYDAGGTNPKLR